MSRIASNFTIGWSNNRFTITYANVTYPAFSFSTLTNWIIVSTFGNYVAIGDSEDTLTTLDWTKCTSFVSTSFANFYAQVVALVPPTTLNDPILNDPVITVTGKNVLWPAVPANTTLVTVDSLATLGYATKTGTETLVAKTLTAPILNDPVINQAGVPYTLPVVSSFVTKTGVETVTNKTFPDPLFTKNGFALALPTLTAPDTHAILGANQSFTGVNTYSHFKVANASLSGYIPAELLCNEEMTAGPTSLTGNFVGSPSVPAFGLPWIYLNRIAKDVSCMMAAADFTTTAVSGVWQLGTPIPARFWPFTNVEKHITVTVGGVVQNTSGVMVVNSTDGSVKFYLDLKRANFPVSTANCGWAEAIHANWVAS